MTDIPYVTIYARLRDAVVQRLHDHPRQEFWDALQGAIKSDKEFGIYYATLKKAEKAEFEAAVMAKVKVDRK